KQWAGRPDKTRTAASSEKQRWLRSPDSSTALAKVCATCRRAGKSAKTLETITSCFFPCQRQSEINAVAMVAANHDNLGCFINDRIRHIISGAPITKNNRP